MVHALNEIHRVLVTDGILIDLRPLLDKWPIEIVSSGSQVYAGQATDLPEPLADDKSANAAMTDYEKLGWFHRESEEIFSLFYYWDTPKVMEVHITENWDDVIRIDETSWKTLRAAWAIANADARVRLRMKMVITRWGKCNL